MRTMRSFLAVIVVALVVGACASGASPILQTVGRPVGETGQGSVPQGAPAPAQGVEGAPTAARDDAKIIRTGSMTLEVSDVAAALRVARDGIVGLGGYVGASTTSNDADRPSAEIVYRIPADRWEAGLDILRGLNGLTTKVVTEHTEAVEVTGQVIDLEARIANLRASETALQGIAAKATKITDVLEVEARLTDTRGQIEVLTGQLKDLNDRAGYATISVRYNVPVLAVDVAAKAWEPTTVVDDAAAAMVSILQNLATAGIWFLIVWLPIFLVLGVAVVLAVWIARRFSRRSEGAVPPTAPVAGEG
jgi:hypothetical protein